MKDVILAALKKAAYRTQILGDNRMHNIIVGEDLEAPVEVIARDVEELCMESQRA